MSQVHFNRHQLSAQGSYLDLKHSMGYKDSETWCVAGLVCWDLAELRLSQIGDRKI